MLSRWGNREYFARQIMSTVEAGGGSENCLEGPAILYSQYYSARIKTAGTTHFLSQKRTFTP